MEKKNKKLTDKLYLETKNITQSCVVNGNSVYYVLNDCGVLVCYEKDKDDIRLFSCGADYRKTRGLWVERLLFHNGDLVGIDQNGERIVHFDVTNRKVDIIPISSSKKPWGNYALIEQVDKNIYCFTKEDGKVVAYDCDSKQVKMDVLNVGRENCGCRSNDQVFFWDQENNDLVMYDLRSRTIQTKEISYSDSNCKHMIVDDCTIYLLSDSSLLAINLLTGNVIKDYQFDHCAECSLFFLTKDTLILLPGKGTDIYIIDKISGAKRTLDNYPDDFCYFEEYKNGGAKYVKGYGEDDRYYYLPPRASDYFVIISKLDGQFEWIKKPEITDNMELNYLLGIGNGIISEKKSLQWFINAL